MKAIVNEIKKSEYPKLMISGDDIVLFVKLEEGTLVSSIGRPEDVGEYSESWDMVVFKDFKGTVTLSND